MLVLLLGTGGGAGGRGGAGGLYEFGTALTISSRKEAERNEGLLARSNSSLTTATYASAASAWAKCSAEELLALGLLFF